MFSSLIHSFFNDAPSNVLSAREQRLVYRGRGGEVPPPPPPTEQPRPEKLSRQEYSQKFENVMKQMAGEAKIVLSIRNKLEEGEYRTELNSKAVKLSRIVMGNILRATPQDQRAKMTDFLKKFQKNFEESLKRNLTSEDTIRFFRQGGIGVYDVSVNSEGFLTVKKGGSSDFVSLNLQPAYVAAPAPAAPGQKPAPAGRRGAPAPAAAAAPKLTPQQQTKIEAQKKQELITKAEVQARALEQTLGSPYKCTVDKRDVSLNTKDETIYLDISKNGQPYGTILWGPKLTSYRFEYYDTQSKEYKKYGSDLKNLTSNLKARLTEIARLHELTRFNAPTKAAAKPSAKPAAKPTPAAAAAAPAAKPAEGPAEIEKKQAIKEAEKIIGRIEYYDKAKQYTFTIDKENSHKHLVIVDVKKGRKDLGSIKIFNPLDAAHRTITYTDTANNIQRYKRADATINAINAFAQKVAPGVVPPAASAAAPQGLKAKPAELAQKTVELNKQITELKGTLGTKYNYTPKPAYGTVELSLPGGKPFAALKKSADGSWVVYRKEGNTWKESYRGKNMGIFKAEVIRLAEGKPRAAEGPKASPETQKAIEAGKAKIEQLKRVPGGKDYDYEVNEQHTTKDAVYIKITNKQGQYLGTFGFNPASPDEIVYSVNGRAHEVKGPKALVEAIKAYEKTLAKREAVKTRTTTERRTQRSKIDLSQKDASEKFGNQMNPEVKNLVTFEHGTDKYGSYIIVKFKGGRRGAAERNLTLGQIFKFAGDDIPYSIRVLGRTWGGRQDRTGTYYANQNEFYDTKGKRITIFQGNKIYFGPRRAPEIVASAALPLREAALRKEAAKRQSEDVKERKDYEGFKKSLGERIRMHDEHISSNHFDAFMRNEHYEVPRFLQNDSDWKANWKYVSRNLLQTLSYPPFNIDRVEGRRSYLQEVIQLGRNAEVQPSDFFRIKIEGRSIYNGSYSKFRGRYEDLLKEFDKKKIDPWGDTSKLNAADKKLVAEFKQMNETIKAIARVLEALGTVTLHKRMPETAEDRYSPTLIGIQVAGKGQKEHYKNVPASSYHSLKSLLHKQENAPDGVSVAASKQVLGNFQDVYLKYFGDLESVPDFMKDYVTNPDAKGGLKLMFMAFGFDYLVAKGYIRKLNGDSEDQRYIIVKTPTKQEWGVALSKLPKYKTKLWDTDKKSFEQWERIRESINRSKAAQRFIDKIFKNTPAVDTRLKGRLKSLFGAGRKSLDMAYLSTVTYNNEFYARFISPERGRISFTNDNLKDKPEKGSTVYELDSQKVLTKANLYIWLALWHDLSFASAEGKYEETVNKLAKDFNIPGSVLAKFDTSNQAPPSARKALLAEIYKRVELKNLDPSKINPAYGEFIRTGFVLARQRQMAGNFDSFIKSLPEGLSTKPMYRKLQIEAFKRGCPIHMLPQIEQRVNAAIFATLNMGFDAAKKLEYVEAAAGGVVNVKLGNWLGAEWKVGISGLITLGGVAASGGIEAAWAWGKQNRWQLGFKLGAGAEVDYGGGAGFHAGAEATFQFPLGKSAWDMYASAWAGIRYKQAALGVGGGVDLGAKWNQAVADRKAQLKSDSKRQIGDIEKLRAAGKTKELADALRKHPVFGEWFKEYERKMTSMNLHVSDEVMVDLYTRTKDYWQNKAREGVEVPPVVGVGVRVIPYPPFVIPYIDINIGGNQVIYTTRREHPLYNEKTQKRVSDEAVNQKIKKEIMTRHGSRVISEYSILAKSGSPYYDARLGRTNVVNRPGEGDDTTTVNFGSRFEAIKREFAKHHIHIRRVKLAGHGDVIELTPLRTEGSNVEFLIPPGLGKALILDQTKNRVLLAASMLKKLYITRQRIELPYRGHGDAVNKEVIVFKTNRYQTASEIRSIAPHTIYKYRDQKYRIVAGARRTGIEGGGDIVTLAEFNERRALEREREARKIPKVLDYKTYMTLITRKPPLSDREIQLHFGQRYGKYETAQAISRFQERIKTDRSLTAEMRKALDFREKVTIYRTAEQLTAMSIDYYKMNKKTFDNLVGSISGARNNEMGIKQRVFNNIQAHVWGRLETQLGRKPNAAERAQATLTQHELNLMYSIILNHSFVKILGGPESIIKRRIEIRNELFKSYLKRSITDWKRKYPDQWNRIKENVDNMPESKRTNFKLTVDTLANHIILTMPQTVKQLKEWISGKSKAIDAGMKFASYSHRSEKNKSMPAAYGMEDHPAALAKSGIFRLINPQEQQLNSQKPLERAAARTILSMLSPLDTNKQRLDSTNEGVKVNSRAAFLKSDLPILLLSLQDPKLRVSPLIRVLGAENFKKITQLYGALKNGMDKKLNANKKPSEWINLLNANEAAFQIFRALVEKVRDAQLNSPAINKNGDKEVVFGNSIIRIHSEIGAGGYLKCMNGTVYLKRSFSFSSTDVERHEWVVASDKRRTGVVNRSGKAARKLTVGAGLWASAKTKGRKRPPEGRRPGKQTPAGRR